MLHDGISLSTGSVIHNMVAESGSAFPLSPVNGQEFQLTTLVDSYAPGIYSYEQSSASWVMFGDITSIVAGTGLSGGGARGAVTISLSAEILNAVEYVANKSTNTALGTSDVLYPTQNAVKTYVDLRELLSHKSIDPALGTSDVLYPSQNAVKTYVDSQISTIGTAISGTESVSNKSIDGLLGASDVLYPSQKAVKTYVDSQISTTNSANEVLTNKSTSIYLGSSNTLYPTQNAVKSYVDTQISAVNSVFVSYEPNSNKSANSALGTSDTLYPTQNAVKTYVDTLRTYVDANLQGLDPKASVHATTTGNITLSGIQVLDGITTVVGRRYLVKNQTLGYQNGIYVCASGSWTRSADADISAEVSSGMYTFIEEGTTQGATGWNLITVGTIVLGTTALTFSQFGAAFSYTAGSGIGINGNVISATPYTAGSGISVAGNVISVSGLTFASLTSKPTTLAGYGITDAFSGTFSSLSGKPTTIAGYGITDSFFSGAFSALTSKPTTVAGYGITDALTTSSLTGLPNDASSMVIGKPLGSQIVFMYEAVRSCSFAANFAASKSKSTVAATASTTFSVQKNGSQVCTMAFAAAGTSATFGSCAATSMVAGDVLTIVAPATADATLANIAITLLGTLA